MSRKRIATSQDSAAILLPQEVLDEMACMKATKLTCQFLIARLSCVRWLTQTVQGRSRKRRRLYLNAAVPPIRNLLKGLNSPCCF